MRNRLDVVGSGALGLGLGIACAQRGLSVRVRGRREYVRVGQLWVGSTETSAAFVPAPHDGPACTILAVKAYDLKRLTAEEMGAVADGRIIVCIQNGLGIREALPFDAPVLRAIVTACAERIEPETVRWREPITVVLDASDCNAEVVATILTSPWIKVQLTRNFQQAVFRKLLINAAINPLTAIHRVDCRTLAMERELLMRAYGVAKEIGAVAEAAGVKLSGNAEEAINYALAFMGSFHPSMLQDISSGRDVEIEAILGEPIKLATALDVSVPTLTSLYQELSAITRRTDEAPATLQLLDTPSPLR